MSICKSFFSHLEQEVRQGLFFKYGIRSILDARILLHTSTSFSHSLVVCSCFSLLFTIFFGKEGSGESPDRILFISPLPYSPSGPPCRFRSGKPGQPQKGKVPFRSGLRPARILSPHGEEFLGIRDPTTRQQCKKRFPRVKPGNLFSYGITDSSARSLSPGPG